MTNGEFRNEKNGALGKFITVQSLLRLVNEYVSDKDATKSSLVSCLESLYKQHGRSEWQTDPTSDVLPPRKDSRPRVNRKRAVGYLWGDYDDYDEDDYEECEEDDEEEEEEEEEKEEEDGFSLGEDESDYRSRRSGKRQRSPSPPQEDLKKFIRKRFAIQRRELSGFLTSIKQSAMEEYQKSPEFEQEKKRMLRQAVEECRPAIEAVLERKYDQRYREKMRAEAEIEEIIE